MSQRSEPQDQLTCHFAVNSAGSNALITGTASALPSSLTTTLESQAFSVVLPSLSFGPATQQICHHWPSSLLPVTLNVSPGLAFATIGASMAGPLRMLARASSVMIFAVTS